MTILTGTTSTHTPTSNTLSTTKSNHYETYMSKKTVEKYITIKEHGTSKTGVTRIWIVENTRSKYIVGSIMWHGAFRKYCFFPNNDTLFDADCMQMIADFLNAHNAAHKQKNKESTGV